MRTAIVLACLLLTATAAIPMASADDPVPEPQCYYIYNEFTAGPVTVIQRSSCQYEVYVFGEPLIGP